MWDKLIKVIVIIGIPSIVLGCIYIGRKLQILDDLKEAIEKIKHNVKVVSDSLTKSKRITFDPAELRSYSPLQLTPKGIERVKEVGFDEIFKNNKAEFFNFIDLDEAKTKYDVQGSSIKSISALLDKEYFSPLKTYLYNHPEIDIKNLITTLGVYLRDKYLEEHPEIK